MLVLAAMLQHFAGFAQQTTTNNIEGTWKGTSLCQVKQSACHDENVVYHISKTSATIYTIQASKVVNGAEEDMGTLDAVYDETKQTLTVTTKDRQGVWLFRIDGMQMHGTLTINENTLFRIVELKKS
jgi:predicted secreted protein